MKKLERRKEPEAEGEARPEALSLLILIKKL